MKNRSLLSFFLSHLSLKMSFVFSLFSFKVFFSLIHYHLSFFLIFLLTSAFFISCSESVSNNEVTFAGKVTLEGKTDFSGVTVSLYEPVELDTALVRINEEYPDIGVQISQETEFDHRGFDSAQRPIKAVATTTTGADGSWQIKVDEGSYNIVLEKEGFGWNYEYENSGSAKINSSLKKALKWDEIDHNANITFENDFIFVERDGFSNANFQYNFIGKNWIVFAEDNVELTMLSPIGLEENSLLMLFSNDSISNSKITYNNTEQLEINKCYFFGDIEFEIENCSFIFKNSLLKNASKYPVRLKNSSGFFQNNIVHNSETGIAIDVCDNVIIKSNIFISNETDIDMFSLDSSTLEGNYFTAAQTNINTTVSNGVIKNNEFSNSQVNIRLLDQVNYDIHYNDFFNSEKNVLYYRATAIAFTAKAFIHYNNFIQTGKYCIEIGPNSIPDSVNASNNYWNTINEADIFDLIYDRNDSPGYQTWFYANYIPFERSSINEAGI